jgi:hypothetical protein
VLQLEDRVLDGATEIARLRSELDGVEKRQARAERTISSLGTALQDAELKATELEALRDHVRAGESVAEISLEEGRDPSGTPAWIPRVPVPDGPIARPDLTVACILDPFSVMAFRYECQLLQFGQKDWKAVLQETRPAFLLVESAWRGNEGRWNYTLARQDGPKPAVRELVAWCKQQAIPTVFWNKEDPNNFDLFVESALLFDHIFTVDEDCVERYRDELGHPSVHVLPFAAQPRIHNPVAVPGRRSRGVVFAGSWYGDKHPNRLRQMELVLQPALDFEVEIFSRFEADERYQFPPGLRERVVGSLAYKDMLTANKLYKVALNVNSVVGSSTMCARRIFELLACGTTIVSGAAPAIENLLGPGQVWQTESVEDTRRLLRMLLRNPEIRDRGALTAMREILRRHTYGHRFDAIASVVGLPETRSTPSLSVVCPTVRPHQIDSILANVERQTYRPLQLVLVLHGFDDDAEAIRHRALSAGIDDVVVLSAERSMMLGGVMNLGCEAAEGDYISKMDDDNFYAPHYCEDLMHAFTYADAGIVGKWAVYTYLGSTETMILRFPDREHRYVNLVQGGTLTMPKGLWSEQRFLELPRAIDTQFLRAARANGVRIYSADRFNYVSVRAADTADHTWKISDEALLANGVAQVFSATFDHVVA